jgi:hypothetical protein
MDLTLGLRAVVLSVVRYTIEQRGGSVETNPWTFQMDCKGIPRSQRDACRVEVETLCSSLETTTLFHVENLAMNVSLS